MIQMTTVLDVADNSGAKKLFCIKVLGADNIMWAVDYPYQETVEATQWLNESYASFRSTNRASPVYEAAFHWLRDNIALNDGARRSMRRP